MSLKLLKHTDHLQLLEGDLPTGKEIIVYTEEEVLRFEGWKQWMSLSEEQREDMMQQTQSAAYQDWMQEEDWEECRIEEKPADYVKRSFKA